MQSVPITTKVASLNPVHGEMYLMLHYVMKFVSDLQVNGFLCVLRFPPPRYITEILLKVTLKTINQTFYIDFNELLDI